MCVYVCVCVCVRVISIYIDNILFRSAHLRVVQPILLIIRVELD